MNFQECLDQVLALGSHYFIADPGLRTLQAPSVYAQRMAAMRHLPATLELFAVKSPHPDQVVGTIVFSPAPVTTTQTVRITGKLLTKGGPSLQTIYILYHP